MTPNPGFKVTGYLKIEYRAPEEEDESDERDAHQSMRFTVRLGTLHKNAVPTRRESQRQGAHTDALQPCHDASISDEDDSDDQPAATASPAAPAAATATTSTSPAPPAPADNCCEVCLIGQRDGVALVPCGHARFCATCVDTLDNMGTGCPICRADIQMMMRVFN